MASDYYASMIGNSIMDFGGYLDRNWKWLLLFGCLWIFFVFLGIAALIGFLVYWIFFT
jgi:hypothetical protein